MSQRKGNQQTRSCCIGRKFGNPGFGSVCAGRALQHAAKDVEFSASGTPGGHRVVFPMAVATKKTGIPKWLTLASGNMDQNLRFGPLLFNFEPHTHIRLGIFWSCRSAENSSENVAEPPGVLMRLMLSRCVGPQASLTKQFLSKGLRFVLLGILPPFAPLPGQEPVCSTLSRGIGAKCSATLTAAPRRCKLAS